MDKPRLNQRILNHHTDTITSHPLQRCAHWKNKYVLAYSDLISPLGNFCVAAVCQEYDHKNIVYILPYNC